MFRRLFWNYISHRLDNGKIANEIEKFVFDHWPRPSMPEETPERVPLGNRTQPTYHLRPAAYRPKEQSRTLVVPYIDWTKVQKDWKPKRVKVQGKTLSTYRSGKD